MNKRITQIGFIILIILLFSLNTFSQTKLNIDINDLRNPDIKFYFVVYVEQSNARFPYYQYQIENDTINDIVYLNGAIMKINLPFDGKIISENVRIEYTLIINDIINKGVLNEKLIVDKENYYKLETKGNKIVIIKNNIIIRN